MLWYPGSFGIFVSASWTSPWKYACVFDLKGICPAPSIKSNLGHKIFVARLWTPCVHKWWGTFCRYSGMQCIGRIRGGWVGGFGVGVGGGRWCLPTHCDQSEGTFYWHLLPLIPAWMSKRMPSKVWDAITYPFQNLHRWSFGMDK